MLPVSFMIALMIAFGLESTRPGAPTADAGFRLLEACGGIGLVALLSLGLGLWVASRVSRDGLPTSRLRHRYAYGARVLSVVALAVYGWIIHSVGWPRVVRANWGLEDLSPIDDLVILLPFLILQLLLWWGQFFAERALRLRFAAMPNGRLGRYLWLRARQSLGLVLPIILLFVIRRDVLRRLWPAWEDDPIAEPIQMIVLGALVLIAAPAFIRLAWPTRSLTDGPLRRRLEQVARRAGFRFADILIWDTGGSILNACVTGIIPGFRYVLLTDALVDTMTPDEVAAVFGHEIGHIAHRHLLYFGFFFAGSLGLLTLLAEVIGVAFRGIATWPARPSWLPPETGELAEEAAVLVLLAGYFWLVFGFLSRRFERQADVFGSKVVSCGRADCPPHDPAESGREPGPARRPGLPLCRIGLRTFSEALAIVAQCNGIELGRRSWRHGSIASRIRFLQRLEREPDGERRFQRQVIRLRIALGVVLVAAMIAAAFRPLSH